MPIPSPVTMPIPALITPSTESVGLESTQSMYRVPSTKITEHMTEKTTRIRKAKMNLGVNESAFRFSSSDNVWEWKYVNLIYVSGGYSSSAFCKR